MNYKKLLKNVLLSVGTVVTANNTVFGISLDEFWNTLEWKAAKKIVKNAIISGQFDVAQNQLIQAGINNPYLAMSMLINSFNFAPIMEANRMQPMEEDTADQLTSVVSGSEYGDNGIHRQQLTIFSGLNIPQENNNYFSEYKMYNHFFCTLPTLRDEATFQSMGAMNFYGTNLKYIEPSASSNPNSGVFCETCDEIFHKSCAISNFYLPFFQYDIGAIFSFFTNLYLIGFQTYGQTIWLPPYENRDRNRLKLSLQEYMRELSEDGCEYIAFDVDAIVGKVNFYTQDQITAIENQHVKFYDFIRYHSLEKYVQYINFNEKPNWLNQYEWDTFVFPIKVEAEKLMIVMRGVQPNR